MGEGLLFLDAVGVLGDEGFPGLGALAGEGLVALVVVAQGGGQGIGGVEQGRHLLLVDVECALQHQGHLMTVSGDVQLLGGSNAEEFNYDPKDDLDDDDVLR